MSPTRACRARRRISALQAENPGDLVDDKQRTDEKESRVFHEGGTIALEGMADELQDPAADEEAKDPVRIEEEERQGDDDRRDAHDVGGVVHRMVGQS